MEEPHDLTALEQAAAVRAGELAGVPARPGAAEAAAGAVLQRRRPRTARPPGVMLAAAPGADALLLAVSAWLEATRPWAQRHPAVWSAPVHR